MPSEAIEVLEEDAIATELAKIGAEPLGNWLSTQQPQVFTEVPAPGAIPRPNILSLYVHHVGSKPGSDEVGLNYHNLDSRFAIWCCSSHALDGRRRMLNLKKDVVAALRNAEGLFRAAFKSDGITVDECTYSNLEEQAGAGVYACIQYVTVLAFDPEPDELRFGAEVLSVDLEKTLVRTYPFAVLPVQEMISAGGGITQRVEPPSLIIETSVQGANRFVESRIEGQQTADWFASGAGGRWWQYEVEIACSLFPGSMLGATATSYMGIEIGSYHQLPPFPGTSTNPVAQLRWSYGSQRWELVSGVGDGITADTVLPLTGVPFTSAATAGARCRLIYDPFVPRLAAYVNGVLAGEIRDPLALPLFANSQSLLLHGAFAATGSNAAASLLRAVFAACHCKLYNPTLPPATLWY